MKPVDGTALLHRQQLLARFGSGCGRDGTTICLQISDGTRVLVDVLRALEGENLVPVSLSVREPSLDDAFLTLTGRRVEVPAIPEPETAATRGAA